MRVFSCSHPSRIRAVIHTASWQTREGFTLKIHPPRCTMGLGSAESITVMRNGYLRGAESAAGAQG
jgi:hypothetical protein